MASTVGAGRWAVNSKTSKCLAGTVRGAAGRRSSWQGDRLGFGWRSNDLIANSDFTGTDDFSVDAHDGVTVMAL